MYVLAFHATNVIDPNWLHDQFQPRVKDKTVHTPEIISIQSKNGMVPGRLTRMISLLLLTSFQLYRQRIFGTEINFCSVSKLSVIDNVQLTRAYRNRKTEIFPGSYKVSLLKHHLKSSDCDGQAIRNVNKKSVFLSLQGNSMIRIAGLNKREDGPSEVSQSQEPDLALHVRQGTTISAPTSPSKNVPAFQQRANSVTAGSVMKAPSAKDKHKTVLVIDDQHTDW
ncbi:uncharacterized protein CEXT_144591 [Caerostris extrusa]|uniref:Uncharacterized protein n=1 Tax=Caerostris extrusa TaxID=172846 RepID=A0AAV4Y5X5_CAEEX|nr:uncharacterized protein CEXT_144591 [Caerostris extrusa]